MLKQHYRRFLAAHPNELHFTAHSHHYWPDVTRDAMLRCWDDAARLVDDKWSKLHGELMPRLQRRIATLLGSATPSNSASRRTPTNCWCGCCPVCRSTDRYGS
ncbi:hypothetical protein [Marinobacterium aestuariivivens]|uniref:Uncharacterized protein n=1 Tax=Marinobacterium aestuariivivens TaxID=1698799 RepID=A0ABW1ZXF2_9GAMM